MRMASDVFSPLSAVELTDARVPRRLLNYGELIGPIVRRLAADSIAGTEAVRSSRFGRWLRVHDKFDVYLVVSLTLWSNHGITPLWCKCQVSKDVAHQLQTRFDDAQVEGSGSRVDLCVPIRLTAGCERDRVVYDAVRQMRSIADKLKAVVVLP